GQPAAQVANLINATNCGSSVGVSASQAGGTLTVTATSVGNNTNALGSSDSTWVWNGTNLTGGTAGQQDATHFTIDSNTTIEASNLAAAFNANGGLSNFGVTVSSGGTSVVTVTAQTPGRANATMLTPSGLTNGAVANTAGNDGTQASIAGFTILYGGADTGGT